MALRGYYPPGVGGAAEDALTLGPEPNRFEAASKSAAETLRDAQAEDRANRDWLKEYRDDHRKYIELIDTAAKRIYKQVYESETETTSTVFGTGTPALPAKPTGGLGGRQTGTDGDWTWHYELPVMTAAQIDALITAGEAAGTAGDDWALKTTNTAQTGTYEIDRYLRVPNARARSTIIGQTFRAEGDTAAVTLPARTAFDRNRARIETVNGQKQFWIPADDGGGNGATQVRQFVNLFNEVQDGDRADSQNWQATFTDSTSNAYTVDIDSIEYGIRVGSWHYIRITWADSTIEPDDGNVATSWDLTAEQPTDWKLQVTIEDQSSRSVSIADGEWDIVDVDVSPAWYEYGSDATGSIADASKTTKGKVELVDETTTEATGGTDDTRAMTSAATRAAIDNRVPAWARGDEPFQIYSANTTFSAAETAALNKKHLLFTGGADRTFTLNDPGGSTNLAFLVTSVASDNTAALTVTAVAGEIEQSVVLLRGQTAACIWDDSADRWEITFSDGSQRAGGNSKTYTNVETLGLDQRFLFMTGTADQTVNLGTPSRAMMFFLMVLTEHDTTVRHSGTTLATVSDDGVYLVIYDGGTWSVQRMSPPRVVQTEINAGTEGSVREFSPSDVKEMIDRHGIIQVSANTAYNAAQTAALNGKIIHAINDAGITITLNDPGGTSDLSFEVVNCSPRSQFVRLAVASGVNSTPTTLDADNTGDRLVAVWDNSEISGAGQWEFSKNEDDTGAPSTGGGGSNIEKVTTDKTYNATESAALDGKEIHFLGDSNAVLRFTDPGGSADLRWTVRNFSPNNAQVRLDTVTGTGDDGEENLVSPGEGGMAVWDSSQDRYEFHHLGPPLITSAERTSGAGTTPKSYRPSDIREMAKIHGGRIDTLTASKTYTAGSESANLNEMMLFCHSDSEIVIKVNDPGGTADIAFTVINFSPSGARVHLQEEGSGGVNLISPGDMATCVWDDSESGWDITVRRQSGFAQFNLDSDETVSLSDYWRQWIGKTVFITSDAGEDNVLTIRPDVTGNWIPENSEKHEGITFHPMFSGGRIQLQNFKFARHRSDGRIEGIAKSATAVNATEGRGEPFKLVYTDYYVNEDDGDGNITSDLHPWHVAPLVQDVRNVITDYDKTVAHRQDVQAVEAKVNLLVSDGDSTLTLPYWPTFNVPTISGWQAYEYNSNAVYHLEMEKGDHKVYFRQYDSSGNVTKEFDLLHGFKDIGLWDDRHLILNDIAAVYLNPTIASGSPTTASLSIVADVNSGRMLAPAPIDVDVTMTAGTIFRAYGKRGSANPLVNRNRISAATTNARVANSLDIFGSSAQLTAINALLTDSGSVRSNARIQMVDNDGDHTELDVTAISAETNGPTYNTSLRRRTLTFNTPSADIIPDYGQSLRFFNLVADTEEWAQVDNDTTIPPNKFASTQGSSSELLDASYNLQTTMQTVGTTPIVIPSDGLLWFDFANEGGNGTFSVPCKLLRSLNPMTVGSNPGDSANAATKAGRQISFRQRLQDASTDWFTFTASRDSSNRLLLGTVDSASAGDDPNPLRIWHIASGVTVDAESDIAGQVIATADVAVRVMDIDSNLENVPTWTLDAGAPSGYSRGGPPANTVLYALSKRDRDNHTGYLIQLVDADDTTVVHAERNTLLGAAEDTSPEEHLLYYGGDSQSYAVVVDFSQGGGTGAGSFSIYRSLEGNNPTAAKNFKVVVRELIVPSATGIVQQQAAGSGAFETVRRSEFHRQAVSGITLNLNGTGGYEIDSEATHAHVTITAPNDFSVDATLNYFDPGDDRGRDVFDADGNPLTLSSGQSIDYRFSDAFFHEETNGNFLKLRLVSDTGSALTGSDLSIDIAHETDIDSASIKPLTLLDATVTVASQTPADDLTGATITEIEFDKFVLWDDIITMHVKMSVNPAQISENARFILNTTRDEMDDVGTWTADDSLPDNDSISGWFSLGWSNAGSGEDASSWRSSFSSDWSWYYMSRFTGTPARIVAFKRAGQYCTGMWAASFRQPLRVEHVSCMRKI